MGIFGPSDTLFKDQNYWDLRKVALESGNAFVDKEFPARDESISNTKRGFVEWKRPSEICSDPKLVVDGVSSHDLIQGELGNCWLVAACSCLATDLSIWQKVVSDLKTQEWNDASTHPGIFHFRFWRYGAWTDVVIDDFLPCRGNTLIYLHSVSKNEFWSALLEKAYAKLYGSYEALDGGELAVALEDFTGGVSEITNLKKEESLLEGAESREEFFLSIKRQFRDHALMAASIPAASQDMMEKPTEMGLVIGHAYSVTAVKRIYLKGTGLLSFMNREKLPMIRLRNPWGGAEWKGAFSDGSEEWSKISSSARSTIGLTFDEDGEFWMTFDDFCVNFAHLAVCHRLSTSFFTFNRWYLTEASGDWKREGGRSGGCINNRDTFLNNPQFVFSVSSDDEVIVVLTQKNVKEHGEQLTAIGFTILKVEENRRYRLHRLAREAFSSEFINRRSVLLRKKLQPGRYVVVVCKFNPGEEGPFLIRVYLRCRGKARALEQDAPVEGCMSCLPCYQLPSLATQVTVVRAVNLTRKDDANAESTDAYCVIKNERDKVSGVVVKNSANPEFNTSALFYRKDPSEKAVVVEIWHKKALFDEFIGSANLTETETVDNVIKEYPITSKEGTRMGGVIVKLSTNNNLATF